MGWESLLLQLDDADTKKQMKEIAGVMGTTTESGTIVTGSIGEAAPKQKIYLVKQDQPHESEGKFLLSVYLEGEAATEDGELHEVYLSIDGASKPSWENLPTTFERGMKNIPEAD